jgi:hypothetical protein
MVCDGTKDTCGGVAVLCCISYNGLRLALGSSQHAGLRKPC